MDLNKKEHIMKLKKAEAAIAELEYKIEERKVDIKRMEDHIKLQQEQIQKCKQVLGE